MLIKEAPVHQSVLPFNYPDPQQMIRHSTLLLWWQLSSKEIWWDVNNVQFGCHRYHKDCGEGQIVRSISNHLYIHCLPVSGYKYGELMDNNTGWFGYHRLSKSRYLTLFVKHFTDSWSKSCKNMCFSYSWDHKSQFCSRVKCLLQSWF